MTSIAVGVFLLAIAYQDIKKRSVHAFLLILLAAALFWRNWQLQGSLWYHSQLFNFMFLAVCGLVVMIYFRLKFGTFKLMDRGLGYGDLIFLIIIASGFYFMQFLIWFNVSLMFSLLIHTLLKRFKWYSNPELVPLAGLQAIALIPFLIIDLPCRIC